MTEECPVCYEPLGKDDILECTHKVHIECVKKSHVAKCPICRCKVNIEVEGKCDWDYIEPTHTLHDFANAIYTTINSFDIGYDGDDDSDDDYDEIHSIRVALETLNLLEAHIRYGVGYEFIEEDREFLTSLICDRVHLTDDDLRACTEITGRIVESSTLLNLNTFLNTQQLPRQFDEVD